MEIVNLEKFRELNCQKFMYTVETFDVWTGLKILLVTFVTWLRGDMSTCIFFETLHMLARIYTDVSTYA